AVQGRGVIPPRARSLALWGEWGRYGFATWQNLLIYQTLYHILKICAILEILESKVTVTLEFLWLSLREIPMQNPPCLWSCARRCCERARTHRRGMKIQSLKEL